MSEIVISDGRTDVTLRVDRPRAAKSYQRTVELDEGGRTSVRGDLKWNGSRLEITATITGTTPAVARAALNELLSVARAAAKLTIDGTTVLVHGPERIRRRERPTGWVVTLVLLAATQVAGVGASRRVHYRGQVLTDSLGQEITYDPFAGSITGDNTFVTGDTTGWTGDHE
jgi:hypothetical protein